MKTVQDFRKDVKVDDHSKYFPGRMVIYTKGVGHREVGTVKRCTDDGCYVWYHNGGTVALTPWDNLSLLSDYGLQRILGSSDDVVNDYAKHTLLHRAWLIQKQGMDINDPILNDLIEYDMNGVIIYHGGKEDRV